MKTSKSHICIVVVILLVALACTSCQPSNNNIIIPAKTLPPTTPWNLIELSAPPEFEWLDQSTDVWALQYKGLPYQNHTTSVFAYYASPDTLKGNIKPTRKYPAVVLVHGGGGQAFYEWAKLWAQQGYAAIAPDLQGNGRFRIPLPDGGPALTHPNIFHTIDEPLQNQWPYHAVANVIRAHSLIRSLDGIDPDRTAITGISWGGYLTCIVAGLDNRFKAAVPVYGCGFLDPDSCWKNEFEKLTPEQRTKWTQLWDPSQYIGSASMPVFFVNGTNDFAYWLVSYAKTYSLVKSPKNFRITIKMPHGHKPGWRPKEIALFINQYLNNGTPLPKITAPQIIDNKVHANIATQTRITSVALNYTTDTTPNNKRNWTTIPLSITNSEITGAAPPPNTLIWFITATDSRDAIVSSPLVFNTP